MARDRFEKDLAIGDRVIYTSGNELHVGIVAKIGTYKTTITKMNDNFTKKESWNAGVPIEHRKIYKIES